ncbi:MAG: nicotinate-nucleotide adenylyltransferase [Chloroflexi bacterium]|nr:nicotinate-nucleotide adenylyltransferase [Chloroflexota bacterium]
MNVGIMGGTFDPVHTGHLIVAEEVREKVGLERMVFLPAGDPYLKGYRRVTPGRQRLEMLQLALAGNPRFAVSTLELEGSGPTYTVETLPQLQQELGPEAKLFFIIGQDALEELPTWREPERILQLCTLVAVPRPGFGYLDMQAVEAALPGVLEHLIFLDGPHIGISSTEIQLRVRRGLSIRYLVPPAVEAYIREQGLYKDAPWEEKG